MKTKSLYVAALMTLAAAFTAVGKDEPAALGLAVVPVKGSEVFRVIYKSENPSKVKLSVYNAASEVVFTETMASVGGFIRPLNFSGLAFGEYTIELTDALGKKSEKVSYQPTKSTTNVHVAKLAQADKFLLSVTNGGKETITVKIFDEANNLVHVSSKEVTGDYAQLFSVKELAGVTFEISNNAGELKTVRF
ncbi:MAG TPA: hypothetical protein VK658_25740 [Chryseolinea sp.]|nr:hypothetical protein [Chryseolinea sp.]